MFGFKRSRVYCSGCAHLLLLPGSPPQCVATANFVDGPLRRRINIIGRVPAEKRNIKNNCGWFEIVSIKAFQLKRWIIWRMNDEGRGSEIQKANLCDYSVSKEGDRSKAYKGEISRVESVDELILAIEEEDACEKAEKKVSAEKRDEDLLVNGGSDDNDGTSTPDKG